MDKFKPFPFKPNCFTSVYNQRMHPLTLGNKILKMKNDFWGLI